MTSIASYNLHSPSQGQIYTPSTSRPVRGDEQVNKPGRPHPGPKVAADSFHFSKEALQLAKQEDPAAAASGPKSPEQLSEQEKQQVQTLKNRDAEVKAHEQAHLSALGGEGGAANYSYTTGPDGRRYATGGEVPVSIGESTGGPEQTIAKAQKIARAAMAPAQPSAADQAARAKANQVEAKARQELQEKQTSGGDSSEADVAPTDQALSGAADLIASIPTPEVEADQANGQKEEGAAQGLTDIKVHDHDHSGDDCKICAQQAA